MAKGARPIADIPIADRDQAAPTRLPWNAFSSIDIESQTYRTVLAEHRLNSACNVWLAARGNVAAPCKFG